jgi:hypothetical protein
MAVFWNGAPYSLVEIDRRFRGAYCGVLMMEAAQTSETSVIIYQTTRHRIPEDSHLLTLRHENLKSYQVEWLTKDRKASVPFPS